MLAQFILSTAQQRGSGPFPAKEKVSNIETTEQHSTATVSSAGEVKYAPPSVDPLNIEGMEPALLVHRFASAGVADVDGTVTPSGLPYSIVLNKYNTIPDHVRCATHASASQPFTL